MIQGKVFLYITIRGRVAYTICCLENAVIHFNLTHLDWALLFDFLWKYPTGEEIKNLALWYENEAECTAFCIMDKLPFEECQFEFITRKQYEIFRNLYIKSNKTIWDLTDSISAIGTQYLYSGIRDGAPETLKYLQNVIDLMNKNNIQLPNLELFKEFNYNENPENDWIVWGNKIEIKQLRSLSNWIKY